MLLAIDQGTSATKAVLVDAAGAIVARGSAPVAQKHPRPGWVEQDAEEVWASVRRAVAVCLSQADPSAVEAVGLSTQRESVVLWERASGRPLGPLLSWQDQRTAEQAARLRAEGAGDAIRASSGLPLDPMFSALKAAWLLDAHDRDRSRARRGELCLGTVDAWLLSRFGGEHVIEVGNAARTQLLDVRARRWDPALLTLFDVPEAALPRVVSSIGPFPAVRGLAPVPDGTPVTAVMGDSHAALYAHAGWRAGYVKATYGTGSSIMGLGDPSAASASDALCVTVAWDDGGPAYAFEGNIRSAGATLTWLAELFGTTPAALAERAADSSEGVHLVPAFGGLGAPWWDDEAVGLLSGLSFGVRLPHLARAALESVAFQVEDVVAAVHEHHPVATLLADGGPTANRALMQLQADTSGRRVEVAQARDLSALGAAQLAGVGVGLWDRAALEAHERPSEAFTPREDGALRERRLAGWHAAVARSRSQRPSQGLSAGDAKHDLTPRYLAR